MSSCLRLKMLPPCFCSLCFARVSLAVIHIPKICPVPYCSAGWLYRCLIRHNFKVALHIGTEVNQIFISYNATQGPEKLMVRGNQTQGWQRQLWINWATPGGRFEATFFFTSFLLAMLRRCAVVGDTAGCPPELFPLMKTQARFHPIFKQLSLQWQHG